MSTMRMLIVLPLFALGACHAHQAASGANTAEAPPKQQQVSSARPVRTTPHAMLDGKSMKQIQHALSERGYHVDASGRLDGPTKMALRRFQMHEKMAATGIPDYDTLRQLDLAPKAIDLGGTHRKTVEKHEAKR
jgi:hypothetical protein